jgi:hypothetical protein
MTVAEVDRRMLIAQTDDNLFTCNQVSDFLLDGGPIYLVIAPPITGMSHPQTFHSK